MNNNIDLLHNVRFVSSLFSFVGFFLFCFFVREWGGGLNCSKSNSVMKKQFCLLHAHLRNHFSLNSEFCF